MERMITEKLVKLPSTKDAIDLKDPRPFLELNVDYSPLPCSRPISVLSGRPVSPN